MTNTLPRFSLFTDAQPDGVWHFRLSDSNDHVALEVCDKENEHSSQRLEVLALVRGLEALEQPSRVELSTASRYVLGGLSSGLAEWRENDWCWESYGELTPIKHSDLWQRVDRALTYHKVECKPILAAAERTFRIESAHEAVPASNACAEVHSIDDARQAREAADWRDADQRLAGSRAAASVAILPRKNAVRRKPQPTGLTTRAKAWVARAAANLAETLQASGTGA